MPDVSSSVIRRIEYDENARDLDVTFVSGKRYIYHDVPLEIYVEFLDASSKGEFFNEHIKDRYAFAELRSGRLS